MSCWRHSAATTNSSCRTPLQRISTTSCSSLHSGTTCLNNLRAACVRSGRPLYRACTCLCCSQGSVVFRKSLWQVNCKHAGGTPPHALAWSPNKADILRQSLVGVSLGLRPNCAGLTGSSRSFGELSCCLRDVGLALDRTGSRICHRLACAHQFSILHSRFTLAPCGLSACSWFLRCPCPNKCIWQARRQQLSDTASAIRSR
jgi:hypothetical protein